MEIQSAASAREVQDLMIPCDVTSFVHRYEPNRRSLFDVITVAMVKEPTPCEPFGAGREALLAKGASTCLATRELLCSIVTAMCQGEQ